MTVKIKEELRGHIHELGMKRNLMVARKLEREAHSVISNSVSLRCRLRFQADMEGTHTLATVASGCGVSRKSRGYVVARTLQLSQESCQKDVETPSPRRREIGLA